MTGTIADLPMEIMDLIVDLISFKDVITCLYVNHEWHDVFERMLYKSIDTRERTMFLAFTRRLTTTATKQQQQGQPSFPLGHYVRELKLCDGFMTQKQMTEMKQLCPNIISLTFRWQDSKVHEDYVSSSMEALLNNNNNKNNDNNYNHAKHRRYYGIPKRMMEMFPAIRRLTLECEPKSRRTRPATQPNIIQSYLHSTEHLRSLTLTNVLRKLTYRQLDLIHESCPNLFQLEISVNVTDFIGYLDGSMEMISEQEQRSLSGESRERLRDLDGPEWSSSSSSSTTTAANFQKLLRIQRISICDQNMLVDLEKWIRYFAARYPDLRSFSFNNLCWGHSLGWSTDNVSPQPWQYVPPLSPSPLSSAASTTTSVTPSSIQMTNSSHNNINVVKQQEKQQQDDNTMGLLAERCPKLHTIELSNVPIPPNAMKHIFSGQELTNVSFKGQGVNLMDIRGYMEMTRLLRPKVVHLSLCVPAPFISHINNIPTTHSVGTTATGTATEVPLPLHNNIINDFSSGYSYNNNAFTHLIELKLIRCGRWFENVLVIMNRVLEACPVLKSLTLVNVRTTAIVTGPVTTATTMQHYPSLKTIKLRNVDLSCGSFMKFVSICCPQLLHFHMLRCTGPSPRRFGFMNGPLFTIDFPNHQLRSLVIFEHVVIPPARVNIVDLNFSNKNNSDHGNRNNSNSSSKSSSSSMTTTAITPTRAREPLYNHWYWVPDNVTPTSFSKNASKNYYSNYTELDFDDSDIINPPLLLSLSTTTTATSKLEQNVTGMKKLSADQGNVLMNYIQSEPHTVSRKRKRAYQPSHQQQKTTKNSTELYQTSDEITNECRKEIDLAGYFSIRCGSISKLVFNGVYLIHNGTCLPSTT